MSSFNLVLEIFCFTIVKWLYFRRVKLKNPNIEKLPEDVLYHFALGTKSHDLKQMFGDVQVRFTQFLYRIIVLFGTCAYK